MELEYKLGRDEQASLAAVAGHPGFRVILKLGEMEAKKFIQVLMNTPASDKDLVITNHIKAQEIAQWFTGFVNRINEEITEYTHAPKASDKPIDVTSGILDLGDEPVSNDILEFFEER